MLTRRLLALLVALLCTASLHAEPHWSLLPRTHPVVPQFADRVDRHWLRTSVDAFVLASLQREGLRPAPEADRRILVRRLSFDLTGLPPTPGEIDAFLRDAGPDAYERLVDRLLASPHYGERWAQHWLDVVRYAESEGFEYDNYRPGMWRYRDYVIRSFNADKPFDRFLSEQIAGDELEPGNAEMHVAVGFHRLGPVRRNAGNQEVASSRNEVLTEMTDSVGMVFLGLTVGCARCHDHRFDDFTQEDYYRLQAFLAGTHEHNIILADARTQADWQALNNEIKMLKKELNAADGEAKERLQARVKVAESKLPPPLPAICTVRDVDAERTAIHVLRRGLPERKGKRVEPGFPSALASLATETPPAEAMKYPRTALARWLSRPDHPLTARVLVNRIWHYHFGRGLVETPNDFGVNGSMPSHPELLDHLANEFVRQGMHLKALHRLIVLSSTYRQAGAHQHDEYSMSHAKDPGNRWLWHFPRRRLSAEEVRDAMLAAAGSLNVKAGGASVNVPVEQDLIDQLYDPTQWKTTPDQREHDRRSIYLIAKRNLRLPFGQVFDQPDLQISCPRREASTHALQALELLNGAMANRLAAAFANRLERTAGSDAARQAEVAFLLTTGRTPTLPERERALEFLRDQPLREFALATFNLNSFMYVD